MEWWVKVLAQTPYIAMILALVSVVVYLFRLYKKTRDDSAAKIADLQLKHTNDLVKATGALQDLTAEYLKQSFADSANWQDRYKSFEDLFKKHVEDDIASTSRVEKLVEDTEYRIKEYVDHAVKDILHGIHTN